MGNEQEAVHGTTKTRMLTARLYRLWDQIIEAHGNEPEITYRIRKLINKLDTITDKMFVKLVKAQEMLDECGQMTRELEPLLDPPEDRSFQLLTNLETHFDELVKLTHEFRVKAG
jgi:hypothetical protein